ncbi:hypothetical protein [Nocardia sp. NPDC058666]|uniref:hypothetical protein n=1 Tax=unclassified Nocardia TaxID=2637762 RepID=UPI0036615F8A
MTSSEPPQSVVQWQGSQLRRIQHLAAEYRRLEQAGPQVFEDGISGDRNTVWRQRLDQLEIQREQAEDAALLSGVDPGWVADARELGRRASRGPELAVVRQHPGNATGVQEFYVDMLEVDLWHLERMASLEAARRDRIDSGRWSFGADPISSRHFGQNMAARHHRASVLAAAAQLSPSEGENLWGSAVEGIRRVHAVAIEAADELSVVAEWNAYARSDPGLRVPPYVPSDPFSGAPTDAAIVVPRSPQQMIADATSALRAQFADSMYSHTEPDLAAESTAITRVVDAALPSGNDLAWEPETDPVTMRITGFEVDRTPDL